MSIKPCPLELSVFQSVLHYERGSGIFYWKSARFLRRGKTLLDPAGSCILGYREVMVKGFRIRLHRLVWFWETGSWPLCDIDHVNGIKDDNRFCNLRLATRQENGRNEGLRQNNTTGHKGVCWSKKENKYVVHIRTGGRKKRIGCFPDLEMAASASRAAIARYHGDFARLC